jgi:iron complex outermembrane receptor protein
MQTNNQLSYNLNGDVSVDPLTALGVPSVALYTNFERSSRNKLKGVNNRDPWADARTWGGSLTATYTLTDDITAKAIYGHREVDASYSIDVDGTNLPVVQSAQFPYSKQDSIELQLTGSSFDDRLEWATGLYWFNETGGEASEQFAVGSPAIPLGAFLPQTGKGENTSESIYMQASYELTDSVRITAGVRHTMDEKGWEGTNFTVPGPDYSTFICNFQAGPGVSTDPCYSDLTEDYEHTSWTIGVDWQVTDDVMLYLKSSNGYRAGGQNMRGKLTAELQPFGPETVTDIETGLKSTLFNQRLRLNIAAFRSDYEEIQTSIFIPTTNALGEPATATVVTNAGEAVIKGVELEATAALTDYLSANVVGSWLDVEYDDPEVDPLQAPEWKYAVGVTWDQPVAFGSASFNINYSWMDSFWVNPSKTTNQAPNAESPSVGLLNARLTFNIDSIDTTVGIWGTNLEDKRYTQNSLLFGVVDFQTFVLATPMEPRMFGLDVTKRF